MLIDNLLQSETASYDSGFINTDLSIIGQVNTRTPSAVSSRYEVNLYSFDGILIESYVENTKTPFRITPTGSYLDVNLSKYFDQSNLNSGKYYYIINAYDQIGGPQPNNLIVEEISSTRTEVRLLRVKALSEFTQSIRLSRSTSPVFQNTTPNIQTRGDLLGAIESINRGQGISFNRFEIYDPNTGESFPVTGTSGEIANDLLSNDIEYTENQLALDSKTTETDFQRILTKNGNFRNIFLNFGQNRLVRILNIELSGAPSFEILVKLYEPLPIDIDVRQFCEIDEVFFSYGDVVEYVQNVEIIDPSIQIQGPNFNIDVDLYKNTTTGFQTWNDLLDVNLSTSQQIIDSYFGQSLQGIKLNIDYSKPEQFIFYSSGEERFLNFYYKIQLIEDYNKQLNTLNDINQTIKSANIIDITKKRNKIITGFDDFEKYLYFGAESGSLYTFYTGSIATWPKTATGSLNWLESYNYWVDNYSTGSLNSNIGYNLQSTTSSIVQTYATDTIAILQEYDKNNISSLLKTVPASILLDDRNSEYFIFVNMIGHHFDIIYTYINHLSSIHSREQHPLDGISKDLLTDVADSFGWKLVNSKKKDSLWQYVTGLDSNGNYIQTGSLTPTISTEQYTLEIWNRIVNNLPYLLKTKGTKRSIQALMSCYGIPSTIINIKEYGGPTTNDIKPNWQVDKFIYSLEVGNNTGSLTIPWDYLTTSNRTPDTLQFRFKPDSSVVLFPRTLLRTDNSGLPYFYITYDQPSGYNPKEGQLTYYLLQPDSSYTSASLNNIPMFNNDWTSINIQRNSLPVSSTAVISSFQSLVTSAGGTIQASTCITNTINSLLTLSENDLTIGALVKNYDNIIYNSSSSLSGSNLYYNTPTNIVIGSSSYSTSNKAFDGNINEIRYWSYLLNNDSMVQYTKNPLFYGGNTDPDAYNYLSFRLPLSYLITATGSYPSVHPNQSIPSFTNGSSSAFFNGFVSTDLGGEDYTTYVVLPSLGSDNIHSEKIRIVNNSLTSSLNTDISVEIPTSEQTPKDTNIVSIYFSPQEMIDSDIYNQLGYFDIDDYIGDPADQNLSYYNDLRVIQYQYWKKYKNSNNLPVLLKLLSVYDYSFFDQLKQLLPARVVLDNSIKIRPNVLERSKITILDDVVVTTPMYDKTIDAYDYINLTGDYPVYDGTIDYTDTLEKAGVYNYSSSKYLPGSGVVNMMVRFEPTGAAVLQNTLSLTRQVFYPIYSTEASASIGKFNSSSYYRAAEVQDYNYSLASFRKRNFEGTKISAAGYNVSSNDLPDKSPVISVTIVKPGTIRNNPAIPPKPPTSPVKSPAPPVSTTNPNANGRTPIGYNSRGFNLG